MFILTSKFSDKYCIYDSMSDETEEVDIDEIRKAVKLGIKIIGVSVVNGKLYLSDNVTHYNKLSLLDNGYLYWLDLRNLIVLSHVPDSENIIINNRVNKIDSNCLCEHNRKSLKVSGGSGLISTSQIFCEYDKCISLDLSDLDTSNVEDMYGMFMGCLGLRNLNISRLNTSNVRDMRSMFEDCYYLVNLDLRNFNTSKVFEMSNMFCYCTRLEFVNVNSFDTSSVKDMSRMFYTCTNLHELDVSNFDTSKVENMDDMFGYCGNLSCLDLRNFDTSNCQSMKNMFLSCYCLTTLNISSFKINPDTKIDGMLHNCDNLDFESLNMLSMDFISRNELYNSEEV